MARLKISGGAPPNILAGAVTYPHTVKVTPYTPVLNDGIVVGIFTIPKNESVSRHSLHALELDDGRHGVIFIMDTKRKRSYILR